MVRLILAALMVLAATAAHADTYVLHCTGPCTAMDGTTQPAGTFIRTFAWDGVTPYTPPPNTEAIPYTGQTLYAPAPDVIAQGLAAVQQAFGTGFRLTSTGTPALNGTYAVTPTFFSAMMGQRECIQATGTTPLASDGKFCSGATTQPIPDASGALHTFDVSHFNQFLLQLILYTGNLYFAQLQLQNGVGASLPTPSATIP